MPKKVDKPQTLMEFEKTFPGVWKSYKALRDACDQEGGLDAKTRELIKIGIETTSRRRGGLIAHINRAKEHGATTSQIYQAMLLALPLVGFPLVLDAFVMAKRAR